MLYLTLYHPKCLLVSKNTFPEFGITRIGHLRAEIQHIIEIWWPFWIMQIRYFPILGFLRTFSMVFWGPHSNSLRQKKLCCNLFQVKPYFAWTIRGFAKKKNSTNLRLGLARNLFCSLNRPKIALNQWNSIPCVFCLYIHC